jgi:hypothetical protein
MFLLPVEKRIGFFLQVGLALACGMVRIGKTLRSPVADTSTLTPGEVNLFSVTPRSS